MISMVSACFFVSFCFSYFVPDNWIDLCLEIQMTESPRSSWVTSSRQLFVWVTSSHPGGAGMWQLPL